MKIVKGICFNFVSFAGTVLTKSTYETNQILDYFIGFRHVLDTIFQVKQNLSSGQFGQWYLLDTNN